MKTVEKERVELRYYELPQGMPLLALLGERWETEYGNDSMHFHNYLEIGYCYKGEGWMCLGDKMVPYSSGCITVIPKNFPHHTVADNEKIQKWEYLFVDEESFLKQAMPGQVLKTEQIVKRLQERTLVLSPGEGGECSFLIKSILDEMRAKGEMYSLAVKAKHLAVLIELVRLNPEANFTETMNIHDKVLESILHVLEYIEKNYQEDIGIEELIQVAHMSETHLRRKFKEYLNISPAEYINLIRIKKACEILERSDDNLSDIALRVGFQTTGTFIRNFKQIVGTVPKEWRRMAKNDVNNPVNYNVSVLKGW